METNFDYWTADKTANETDQEKPSLKTNVTVVTANKTDEPKHHSEINGTFVTTNKTGEPKQHLETNETSTTTTLAPNSPATSRNETKQS